MLLEGNPPHLAGCSEEDRTYVVNIALLDRNLLVLMGSQSIMGKVEQVNVCLARTQNEIDLK